MGRDQLFTSEEVRGKLFYKWVDLSREFDHLLAQKGAAIVQNRMDIPLDNVREWKQNIVSIKSSLDERFEGLLTQTIEYLIKDK